MKPITVSAARDLAEHFGYDQVVIIARKVGVPGGENVVTFGVDEVHRDVAARMGDFLKYRIMGWEEEERHEDFRESDDRPIFELRTAAGIRILAIWESGRMELPPEIKDEYPSLITINRIHAVMLKTRSSAR
jgi:hypothetical protein